jgi:RimJ/RimL family protein N-acetyltransferase
MRMSGTAAGALGWHGALVPGRCPLEGRHVRLDGLRPNAHAEPLFRAAHEAGPVDPQLWAYLAYGPFADAEAYRAWLWSQAVLLDPVFYTLTPVGGSPCGLASYLRIDAKGGSIEIGHLLFAPPIQRTPAATEAIFLMLDYAFRELGYRRVEWKCNALNARSRRAAERYGFSYEGTFRQATVVRDRNRDTAWYSILDREWPSLRAGFEAWLDPSNFDAEGRQRRSLGDCRS